VVEIGCGTGQLTTVLAALGLVVDAVDPGAQLVERARSRVDGESVRFHVARFEDVVLPEGAFDAAFSATAFHWVDPTVGWGKVARLLRPGGVLALLQTGLGGVATELAEDILAAWSAVLPAASEWTYRDPFTLWRGVEERRGNVAEVWAWVTKHDLAHVEAASLFGEVEVLAVPVPQEQTVEEYLALLRTTSSYLRLETATRGRLEKRIRRAFARGEGIRQVEWTTLVTTRRR
jgi:SAM-dependent methyltransferase